MGLDAEEDEKTLDATEHKGSQECTNERNSAPRQLASAENCGGYRRKLHRCAETAVGIANESGIQHTGKRCQHAADNKNSKFYFADLYSPGKARDGIATDGKDAISYRGFEDHQLKHHEDDEYPNYAGIDPGETAATDSVIDKLLPNCLGRGKRKTRGDGITNALKEKSVPRVTSRDGTPRNATKTPLNAPIRIPQARAARSARPLPTTGASPRNARAPIPETEPTDMSISPVAITIATPNAITANTAVICDNDCMLPTDSQLPWVMIAKAKEIRTTMLIVAASGCLRTICRRRCLMTLSVL